MESGMGASYCYPVMGYGDFGGENCKDDTTYSAGSGAGSSYFCNFSANLFFVAVRSTYRKIAPAFSAVILGQKIL